jgi:hypothetical protein
MFRASTAHHQEVKCIDVVNVTSKLSVSETSPLTVAIKVKQVPFATLYTRPPDDGLQMGPKHVEAW